MPRPPRCTAASSSTGFGLRDSVGFEDWQLFEADSLRRTYAAVLERLARARAEAGTARRGSRPGPPLARARRAARARTPTPDRGLRPGRRSNGRAAAVPRVRPRARPRARGRSARGDDRALRRDQRERARAGLRRPGVDGEPARAPGARRLPSRRSRPGAAASRGGDGGSASPDGRLVVVEGEAGIGKTRLVDELCRAGSCRRDLGRSDALAAKPSRTSPTPSSPTAIRDALGGPEAGSAWTDCPRMGGRGRTSRPRSPPGPRSAAAPVGEGPGARSRFLRGPGATLCGAPRGLVVVDDAHWIDDGSLEVLAYVAPAPAREADLPGSDLEDRRRCPRACVCGGSSRRPRATARQRRSRRHVSRADEVAELAASAGSGGAGVAALPRRATGSRSSSSSTSPRRPRPARGDWPLPGSIARARRRARRRRSARPQRQVSRRRGRARALVRRRDDPRRQRPRRRRGRHRARGARRRAAPGRGESRTGTSSATTACVSSCTRRRASRGGVCSIAAPPR